MAGPYKHVKNMVVGDGSENALAHRHYPDVRLGSGRMLAERVMSVWMEDVLWCKAHLAVYAKNLCDCEGQQRGTERSNG